MIFQVIIHIIGAPELFTADALFVWFLIDFMSNACR